MEFAIIAGIGNITIGTWDTDQPMPVYLFFREHHGQEFFYPIEEVSDEKVRAHGPLNPGTVRIEDIDGKIIWPQDKNEKEKAGQ